MKLRVVISSLAILLLFSACSEKKQLTEMHDATVDMNGKMDQLHKTTSDGMRDTINKMEQLHQTTTEGMQETVKGMKQSVALTASVLDTSNELGDLSKHGASVEGRNNRLKNILEDATLENKVTHAAIYFKSFEYQFWQGSGQDASLKKRQHLIDEAAAEFFRAIAEFNNGSPLVNPFATPGVPLISDYGNREAIFNAFALTLHELDRKQEEMLRKYPEIKPVSMLSIIKDALTAEKDINSGKIPVEEISEATHMVLTNKDVALKLLQARLNFALSVFICSVSKLKTAQNMTLDQATEAIGAKSLFPKTALVYDTVSKLWNSSTASSSAAPKTFGQVSTAVGASFVPKAIELQNMKNNKWTVDMDKFNLSQLIMFQRYLGLVKKTQILLVEIGEKVQINEEVGLVLANMEVKSTGLGGAKLAAEKTNLLGLMQELRQFSVTK